MVIAGAQVKDKLLLFEAHSQVPQEGYGYAVENGAWNSWRHLVDDRLNPWQGLDEEPGSAPAFRRTQSDPLGLLDSGDLVAVIEVRATENEDS